MHRMLLTIGLVALPAGLFAAFPAPAGYVNDFASVLEEQDEAYLEAFLGTLERDTTAEVVLATVSSLDGMDVEQYANRLFAEWGIGQAERDNGVLLLVAPSERAVRIEVGYGLEPTLPDGLAGEIIRTEILPEFRAGNVPRGIGRGLNRIAQVVRGDPAAAASAASRRTADDAPPLWFIIPFFATFLTIGSFAAGLGLRTKTYGPLLFGSMFVGIPLLLTLAFASFMLAVFVPLGLALLLAGYTRGDSAYWTGILRRGRPDTAADPDEWIMGGSPGSSTGGSSDSGGSSSGSDFGGGSSGGGGASGRW